MRAALALAVVLALGATREAGAADRRQEGLRHVKKANQLSAAGKCRPAIPEFTKAYQLLRDPALLFNRAECERKLGESKRAVADYRRFLTEMPSAPNRKEVEARLASLDPGYVPAETLPPRDTITEIQGPAPGAGEGRAPAAAPGAGAPPPAAPGAGPPAVAGASATPAPPAPGAAPAPAPEGTPPAEVEAPAVPLPVDRPAPVGLGERPPPEPDLPPRRGTSAWLWIGLGALAVAAGAAGGWYAYSRSRTDVPASTLGNYKF